MITVCIVHGCKGHPDKNWYPWLKKELEKLGCRVIVPAFPTPKNQTLQTWLAVLSSYDLPDDTIYVGNSLGVAFILHVLEERKALAAFFVAGFIGDIDYAYNSTMTSFTQKPFLWNKIKKNCRLFQVIISDDDPFVTVEKGDEIAHNLGVSIDLVQGAGHFNTRLPGWDKFPLLLQKIRQILL